MTYQDLRQQVIDNGGVMTTNMGVLRDVHGAGKLGVHVRANISKELRRQGMAHYPEDLPIYQDELVRVYMAGTPAGDLIEAVLSVSEESDQTIRDAVEKDASVILERVRELVCD